MISTTRFGSSLRPVCTARGAAGHAHPVGRVHVSCSRWVPSFAARSHVIPWRDLQVYKGGGVRALFAGAGPRTTRTAAGYAIVTSLFEVFKTYARQSPGMAG